MHQFMALFIHSQASEQDPREPLAQEKVFFSLQTAVFYQLHNGQVQVACVLACTAL